MLAIRVKGEKMENEKNLVSEAFKVFSEEAPEHAEAWMKLAQGLSGASSLDPKTHSLAYLSVLAALRRTNGMPFHVKMAKNVGASRDEIISAILVGLPSAGHVVTESLPVALDAFDNGQ
jgi:alkylhydroperoxidase/carboxymuconolactone decarboxylase family protein YurZ